MRRLAPFLLLLSTAALANDAAVETAAGGIRLTRVQSVKMVRERLFISPKLVRVDYVFRNTGTEPVTSEVGFPIPPMRWEGDDPGPRGFADFRAWVDERPAPVEREVRALASGREVTDDLKRAGLTIDQWGKFDPFAQEPAKVDEIQRLPRSVKERLAKAGALESPTSDDPHGLWSPKWEVNVLYHWTQTFPPGRDVRVHHEYQPVAGFEWEQPQEMFERHEAACLDPAARREVERRAAAVGNANKRYLFARWVKYVLTTANSWQTPIADFQLIVERPKGALVSFCWDGDVTKTGPERFVARAKDFVPKKELEILYVARDGSGM